jgi:hypothetical protein
VQLHPLKIKVNADHAGLSHLLELYKVPHSISQANFSHSLSNNLLTAPKLMEIKLAMVV